MKGEEIKMWDSILFFAIAVSLGWAIRGTILGGTRGAMLPGILLGLAMAKTLGLESYESYIVLAGAGAIGFSFGGRTTYGETLSFTQDSDPPSRYWWGILGTCIKGSVWIGLGSLIVGMVMGTVEYTLIEWVGLVILFQVTMALGIRILNGPMEPPHRLPKIYFSVQRQEAWGGMWLTYIVFTLYTWLFRQDYVAVKLGLVGLLGGALGFPIGQMLHSWGARKKPFGQKVQAYIDWWKVMEFTFGAVAGGILAWGWWYIQKDMHILQPNILVNSWSINIEWITIIIWGALFILIEFLTWESNKANPKKQGKVYSGILANIPYWLYQMIPLVFIGTGSRLWAYFLVGTILTWMSVKKVVRDFYLGASVPKYYLVILPGLWLAYGVAIWQGYMNFKVLWISIIAIQVILSGVTLTKGSRKSLRNLQRDKQTLATVLRALAAGVPVFILMVLQMIYLIMKV